MNLSDKMVKEYAVYLATRTRLIDISEHIYNFKTEKNNIFFSLTDRIYDVEDNIIKPDKNDKIYLFIQNKLHNIFVITNIEYSSEYAIKITAEDYVENTLKSKVVFELGCASGSNAKIEISDQNAVTKVLSEIFEEIPFFNIDYPDDDLLYSSDSDDYDVPITINIENSTYFDLLKRTLNTSNLNTSYLYLAYFNTFNTDTISIDTTSNATTSLDSSTKLNDNYSLKVTSTNTNAKISFHKSSNVPFVETYINIKDSGVYHLLIKDSDVNQGFGIKLDNGTFKGECYNTSTNSSITTFTLSGTTTYSTDTWYKLRIYYYETYFAIEIFDDEDNILCYKYDIAIETFPTTSSLAYDKIEIYLDSTNTSLYIDSILTVGCYRPFDSDNYEKNKDIIRIFPYLELNKKEDFTEGSVFTGGTVGDYGPDSTKGLLIDTGEAYVKTSGEGNVLSLWFKIEDTSNIFKIYDNKDVWYVDSSNVYRKTYIIKTNSSGNITYAPSETSTFTTLKDFDGNNIVLQNNTWYKLIVYKHCENYDIVLLDSNEEILAQSKDNLYSIDKEYVTGKSTEKLYLISNDGKTYVADILYDAYYLNNNEFYGNLESVEEHIDKQSDYSPVLVIGQGESDSQLKSLTYKYIEYTDDTKDKLVFYSHFTSSDPWDITNGTINASNELYFANTGNAKREVCGLGEYIATISRSTLTTGGKTGVSILDENHNTQIKVEFQEDDIYFYWQGEDETTTSALSTGTYTIKILFYYSKKALLAVYDSSDTLVHSKVVDIDRFKIKYLYLYTDSQEATFKKASLSNWFLNGQKIVKKTCGTDGSTITDSLVSYLQQDIIADDITDNYCQKYILADYVNPMYKHKVSYEATSLNLNNAEIESTNGHTISSNSITLNDSWAKIKLPDFEFDEIQVNFDSTNVRDYYCGLSHGGYIDGVGMYLKFRPTECTYISSGFEQYSLKRNPHIYLKRNTSSSSITPLQDTSIYKNGSKSLKIYCTNGETLSGYVCTDLGDRYFSKIISKYSFWLRPSFSSDTSNEQLIYYRYPTRFGIIKDSGDSSIHVYLNGKTSTTLSNNTWYLFEVEKTSLSSATCTVKNTSGTTVFSSTTTSLFSSSDYVQKLIYIKLNSTTGNTEQINIDDCTLMAFPNEPGEPGLFRITHGFIDHFGYSTTGNSNSTFKITKDITLNKYNVHLSAGSISTNAYIFSESFTGRYLVLSSIGGSTTYTISGIYLGKKIDETFGPPNIKNIKDPKIVSLNNAVIRSEIDKYAETIIDIKSIESTTIKANGIFSDKIKGYKIYFDSTYDPIDGTYLVKNQQDNINGFTNIELNKTKYIFTEGTSNTDYKINIIGNMTTGSVVSTADNIANDSNSLAPYVYSFPNQNVVKFIEAIVSTHTGFTKNYYVGYGLVSDQNDVTNVLDFNISASPLKQISSESNISVDNSAIIVPYGSTNGYATFDLKEEISSTDDFVLIIKYVGATIEAEAGESYIYLGDNLITHFVFNSALDGTLSFGDTLTDESDTVIGTISFANDVDHIFFFVRKDGMLYLYVDGVYKGFHPDSSSGSYIKIKLDGPGTSGVYTVGLRAIYMDKITDGDWFHLPIKFTGIDISYLLNEYDNPSLYLYFLNTENVSGSIKYKYLVQK